MPLVQVSKTKMCLPDDSTDWRISLPVGGRTETRFGQTKGGTGSTNQIFLGTAQSQMVLEIALQTVECVRGGSCVVQHEPYMDIGVRQA